MLTILAGVVGTIAAVTAAILMGSRFRRNSVRDLGTVSHQWIAEQRLGQGNYPQR